MYQPRQFDPALLSLMSVAKKVTPQGQPTVAAGIMQQAGVPPQAMPPGPPQGMPPPPPQGMPPPQQGLPGVLQQTQQAAPSVAKNMQEAQNQQMLAQAQPQQMMAPTQPAMMAEGGIASLPVGMEEYADGGIVGYDDGGYVDPMGGVYDGGGTGAADLTIREAMGLGNIRNRKAVEELEQVRRGVMPKTAVQPFRFESASNDPTDRINKLVQILQQETDESVRSQIAQEIQKEYVRLGQVDRTAEPAPSRMGAVPPAMSPVLSEPSGSETMYGKRLSAIQGMKRSAAQTPQELAEARNEYLQSLGLPTDSTAGAAQRLKELEDFDAQTEKNITGQRSQRMQNALEMGLMGGKPTNLGELLRQTGMGLSKTEELIRQEGIAGLDKKRAQMLAMNTYKTAIEDARRKEAMGDLTGSIESKKTADAAYNSMQTLLADVYGDQAKDLAATERAKIAPSNIQELEWARRNPEAYLAAKSTPRAKPEESRAAAMERYADNWEKLDPMQKSELSKEGVTNFAQYVQMRDRMIGGTTAGKTMTMADVQATAARSGKSADEVIQAAKARGFTIQ